MKALSREIAGTLNLVFRCPCDKVGAISVRVAWWEPWSSLLASMIAMMNYANTARHWNCARRVPKWDVSSL